MFYLPQHKDGQHILLIEEAFHRFDSDIIVVVTTPRRYGWILLTMPNWYVRDSRPQGDQRGVAS